MKVEKRTVAVCQDGEYPFGGGGNMVSFELTKAVMDVLCLIGLSIQGPCGLV